MSQAALHMDLILEYITWEDHTGECYQNLCEWPVHEQREKRHKCKRKRWHAIQLGSDLHAFFAFKCTPDYLERPSSNTLQAWRGTWEGIRCCLWLWLRPVPCTQKARRCFCENTIEFGALWLMTWSYH